MTILTLVRHGQTDWNLGRRIQGSTDVPLNDTGRAQAREAAAVLRAELAADAGAPVPALYSSDLGRARETAEIIAGELGLPAPLLEPGLRERTYGEAEGVLVDDFLERFGSWERDDVPGVEPRAELRDRAVGALRRIDRDVRWESAPVARRIVAVSHGALIGELIRHASGQTLPLEGEKLANASVHTFRIDHGSLRLLRYDALIPA